MLDVCVSDKGILSTMIYRPRVKIRLDGGNQFEYQMMP